MVLYCMLDCVVLYVMDGIKFVYDLCKCIGDEYNVVEFLCNCFSYDDDVIFVFLYGFYVEVVYLLVRKGGYVIFYNVYFLVLKFGGFVFSVLDVIKFYLELCVYRGIVFGCGIFVLFVDLLEVN